MRWPWQRRRFRHACYICGKPAYVAVSAGNRCTLYSCKKHLRTIHNYIESRARDQREHGEP